MGLGYIRLGQPATTLSGGEAQRVKLATELVAARDRPHALRARRADDRASLPDTEALLDVLQPLVDGGNTVVVIEHHLDVIKNADWVIDLGPEGGDAGGELIIAGTPEQVAAHETSYTARFLRDVLARHGGGAEPPPAPAKRKRAAAAAAANPAAKAKAGAEANGRIRGEGGSEGRGNGTKAKAAKPRGAGAGQVVRRVLRFATLGAVACVANDGSAGAPRTCCR